MPSHAFEFHKFSTTLLMFTTLIDQRGRVSWFFISQLLSDDRRSNNDNLLLNLRLFVFIKIDGM